MPPAPSSVLFLALVAMTTAASEWEPVGVSWIGNVFEVAIDQSTGTIAVAAGVEEQGGSGLWLSTLPGAEWSFAPVDYNFVTSTAITRTSRIVTMGVASDRKHPTAWLSDDGGATMVASDSTHAALSGQDLKAEIWADRTIDTSSAPPLT